MGGAGTFDGVLLNAFTAPRIEGTFAATRMRAWDVEWGAGQSRIVVENGYVDVTDARGPQGQRHAARERALLARVPAQGRGRGDQRRRQDRQLEPEGPPPRLRSSTSTRSTETCPASSICTTEYLEPHGFGRVTVAPAHRVRRDGDERVGRRCGSSGPGSGSTASRSARARPASCAARRTSSGRGSTPSTWTRGRSPSSRSTC